MACIARTGFGFWLWPSYDPAASGHCLSVSSCAFVFRIFLQVVGRGPRERHPGFANPSCSCVHMACGGVQMRNFAKSGESLPDGFMCPGGWQVLVEYYQSLNKEQDNDSKVEQVQQAPKVLKDPVPV